MWPASDRRNDAIINATRARLDWARFLRVVRRHKVLGLVNDGLRRARPNVPAKIAAEIASQAGRQAYESLAMAVEAVRLQRLFVEEGLPVLFLKGASLAALAYNNLGLRESKDIDLLVLPDTLQAAMAIVERAGYRRHEPPPDICESQLRMLMPLRRDFGYLHEVTGQQLELHWRLCLNPHLMDESTAMTSSRVVSLSETTGLRTLGEDDLFVYLCVHGALHWWYELRWLSDISALLSAAPGGAAQRLNHAAKVRGAGRPVAQALLLCRNLLQTPLPDPLIKELGESPRVRWLQGTALSAMTVDQDERRPLDVRFGTTRGSLSALLLGQNWRYRVTELRNLLTNQSDVLAVPLPRRLWFLYPVLRLPFWIWRHASRRSRTATKSPRSR
jgi:hypothetical protein